MDKKILLLTLFISSLFSQSLLFAKGGNTHKIKPKVENIIIQSRSTELNDKSGKLYVTKKGLLVYSPFIREKNLFKGYYKYYYFSYKTVKKLLKKSPFKTKQFSLTFYIKKQKRYPRGKKALSKSKYSWIYKYYCKVLDAKILHEKS